MGLRELVARSRVLVEDMVLTSPRLAFRPQLADGADTAQHVENLRGKGYASIGSLLAPGDLAGIRAAIDAALDKQRPDIEVKWSDKVQYARVVNPLRLHARLVLLAVHPLAIAIAEAYFRRQPYLADVDLRRVEPASMVGLGPEHG